MNWNKTYDELKEELKREPEAVEVQERMLQSIYVEVSD